MKIEQLYTECLAQGAYYLESDGEAAIIDPLREVQPYLEKLKNNGVTLKYIFETHFHADFVSGHLSLSKATGAPIVYGPQAHPAFKAIIAKDEQEFKIGKIILKALHTPGHTLESTTYLVKDENGKEHAIFSGDTLFLGDVGRPDLAQKAADITQEELAGILFDSLRNKIMPLANDIIVYPAHGAGSACGKNMMKETVDTLGNQKKVNYALRADMTREEFIEEVTNGLLPPPKYFPSNAKMNKEGYEDINTVIARGLRPLTPSAFETAARRTEVLVLDVRHRNDFKKAHIPRSIFIGLEGSFAPWVGTLIANLEQPLLLVTPQNREEEAIIRLSRVGFDNVIGYLDGGIEAWQKTGKTIDTINSISAMDFEKHLAQKIPIFDVRKATEYNKSHIKNAMLTPLKCLNDHLSEFPKEATFYVHCAGGYRSVIAASILKNKGIHNLVDIAGGFKAIQSTNIPIANPINRDS